MSIGVFLYDMQNFGGLEEYAVELAAACRKSGDDVTVYCTFWAEPENQYRRRIEAAGIRLVQPPKWLSMPASHWPAKERWNAALTNLASPLTLLLAGALWAARRSGPRQAWTSARGWLRGQFAKLTSPDRREALTRAMLRLDWLRGKPDVVHIHGYTRNLLFAIDWVSSMRVPVVYEEHQTPDAQFDWWEGSGDSINRSSRILACSEASAEAIREVCGARRPIVPRPPLCPDPWPQGWSAPAEKEAGAPPIISVVARLVVAKGMRHLLDAVAIVRRSHPDAVFRVYGDGVLRDDLLAYAAELGLDGEQIFVGPFSRGELKGIMLDTDIWASASILEGQSLALVEAMAYGCAIAATDAGGSAELIRHEENGLLCPRGDAESLARDILRLIESPGLRRSLAASARRSYEDGLYQADAVARFIRGVYSEAVDEAASSASV